MTIFSSIFDLKHFEVPQFRGTKFWISDQKVKRIHQQKFSCSILSQAKVITKNSSHGLFDTAQVSKLLWFEISSTCSRLEAWTFKIISKKTDFALILQNFGKIYFFITTRNAILTTNSCIFITFWLRCHNLLLLFTCISIRGDSELIRVESALLSAGISRFQSWFSLKRRWPALNFSVVNTADSQSRWSGLNCAEQRRCFLCFLIQRWKTSNLWNSAVQRWITLGLLPG